MKQLEVIKPTKENVLVNERQVPILNPIYGRPKAISKLFDLSLTSANKYAKEMRDDKDFEHYILMPAPGTLLIHIKGFEVFIRSRQKKSFSKLGY